MAKSVSAKAMLIFYKHALNCYDKTLRPYVKSQFEGDFQQAKSLQKQLVTTVRSSHSKLPQWNNSLDASLDKAVKSIRLLDKPFRLFVIGSGNVGKSTVINTLVGEKVAEMGVLPKTWRLDTYLNVDNDTTAELHYANQRVLHLPKEEADKKVAEEDKNAAELDERIQKECRALRQNSEFDEERKTRAKQRLLAQYDTPDGLTEVIWSIPHNTFLKDFTLVDTPGTNQTLYNSHIQRDAYHYYQEANGILWILPTDKLSDEQTNASILKMANLFQGKMSRTIAILNKWDAAEANGEEKETMVEAKRLFGKYFSEIIPYHAKADWKAISKNNELPQETEALRQEIHNRFYRISQEVQINDVENALKIAKMDTNQQIDRYKSELATKKVILNTWKSNWNKISKENQRNYIQQVDSLKNHQLERICYLAEQNESTLQNLDNSRKNNFFEQNILHYGEIKEQYQQLEKDIIRHMHLVIGQYLGQFTAAIQDKQDSFGLDIIVPEIRYLISDADFYPLAESIDLSTNKVGNFFRRIFSSLALSNTIKTKYTERFNQVTSAVVHDLESAFSSYNQQMYNKMEQIFADSYFPVEKYDKVVDDYSAYKQFIANWQVKKPTLLHLLGKEA